MIYDGKNETSVFTRCQCGAFKRFENAAVTASGQLLEVHKCPKCRAVHSLINGYDPNAYRAISEEKPRVAKEPEGHRYPTTPQTRTSPPANSPLATFIGLGVAIWLGYLAFGPSTPSKEAKPLIDDCSDKTAAYVYGTEFVKRRLKAPATATFAPMTNSEVIITTQPETCTHTVAGYVDAQNSFGALIRSPYSVTVQYINTEKSWKLVAINIERQT